MRVIGLFLVAGLMMAQAPSYEAVANTRQIMQGMVDPASRAIAAICANTVTSSPVVSGVRISTGSRCRCGRRNIKPMSWRRSACSPRETWWQPWTAATDPRLRLGADASALRIPVRDGGLVLDHLHGLVPARDGHVLSTPGAQRCYQS